MNDILVLGAGMVGSAMAIDLSKDYPVTVADISSSALEKITQITSNINTITVNLNDRIKLEELVKPFDLVLCAVPGFMGYQTLSNLIDFKKNVVDISFFPEDALSLQKKAEEAGVTVIVDCGVAPGLGNIILGYYDSQYKVKAFECLVGGLPKFPKAPFKYKAPFSPVDVIEEYVRPARLYENSTVVVKEALSESEMITLPKVGELEAFNTDGLRTLLQTMKHIPNMREKTLRFPGHIDIIKAMKMAGFFSENEVLINGAKVKPIDFSSNILFDDWKLGKEEVEFTVMRITVETEDENFVYHLYDEYHPATKVSSMSRTTGYTATAAVNLITKGIFAKKGLFPPELIGREDGCFEFVVNYLKEREIELIKNER